MNKNKNPSNVGGALDSISKSAASSKRPIDKHGNYDGTDIGFTSSSFSDQTVKD